MESPRIYIYTVVTASVSEPGSSCQYGLDDGRSTFDPRQRRKDFSCTLVSRPALRPTQSPVQCVPRVLSPRLKRGRGVTLTTHPHLVPRSRMSRSHTSSPPKRLRGVYWDSFFTASVKYMILLLTSLCPARVYSTSLLATSEEVK
jgi:hypothetical protein